MLGEDYMGKRKMYLGGMLLISLGMLLMFLSQSMAMAVVGQVLFGFFALALKRFSVALISDTTKPQLSEKFVSTLQGSYSIGAIIGPPRLPMAQTLEVCDFIFLFSSFHSPLPAVLCFPQRHSQILAEEVHYHPSCQESELYRQDQ